MKFARHWSYACALRAALAFILGAPALAEAQHGHGDMEIGSSADGAGDLLAEYDFRRILRTDFAAEVGPLAVYSSTTPGLAAAADEPPDIFELDVGTTVDVRVVAIDQGVSLQIGAMTLAAPGDAATIGTHDGVPGDDGALHAHPTYQVLLDAPKGQFGEGAFSFVLEDPAAAYGESEVYTLHVSNGYLPPVETASALVGRCRSQIGREVGKLLGVNYKTLARCLDQVQAWKAAGGDVEVDPIASGVQKACSDPSKGIVAKTSGARAKALQRVVRRCLGTFGEAAEDVGDALSPHIGMAACRVEELIGAAYSSALEDVAHVVFSGDEEAAEEAFPCIRETQGSTVPVEE